MLSCFPGCTNAVQAYHNYCPSYTLRINSRKMPFQKTGRLAAHLMPHRVHTDSAFTQCADGLWNCTEIALLLLGNVCTSFSAWTCRQPQNGWFWLSAGLEYLSSGIPGLASAAATLPTVDWVPVSLSLADGSRCFFFLFVEELSSMTCGATNHNWRYAQTGSVLIQLTGTMLRVVGVWETIIDLPRGHHPPLLFSTLPHHPSVAPDRTWI